jgi:hypothetical protein
MTKPARDANLRWPGFLLAALVAALVMFLGAGTASAATATAAQTRVGAHTLVAQVAVGPDGGIGAGQRLGNNLPAYDSALATGVAAESGDEFVNLATEARTTHILQGDATGGGHLWPGLEGKTPFPQGWSGGQVMHEISDIATDPAAWANATRQGSRTVLSGTRGGVDIRVIVRTDTGEIITGYPTNLLRNP